MKTTSARVASQTFSPPSSPASPRTQKSLPRKAAAQRTTNGNPQTNNKLSSLLNPNTSLDPTTSLPTPSKTPRKKHGPSQAAFSSTSRVLFSNRPATIEETMPTPKKGKHARKSSAFGLDGSMDDQDLDTSDSIEIYTDSKERMPVKDQDTDNPFVNHGEQPQPKNKGSGKRRRGQSSSDRRMDEAVENGEGMIYVFRGKRVFRSFDNNSRNIAVTDTADEATRRAAGATAGRPLTRTNFKPRLLFPNEAQTKARQEDDDEDDREAVTDIDERIISTSTAEHQAAPSEFDMKKQDQEVITPVKQDFSPATPPSTVRATRSSTKKDIDTSPLARATHAHQQKEWDEQDLESGHVQTRHKKPSPFDKWPRAKSSSRSVSGVKREAEPLEKGEGQRATGKRTRSGAAGPTE
ncbi:MAG: hypothetical protein Q9165_004395 [Trypethelium subeluteriae]